MFPKDTDSRWPLLEETMPTISALKHHWIYYGNYGYGAGKGHDVFGPNWTGSAWHTTTSNEVKDICFSAMEKSWMGMG